ncbi:MAG: glycosyltransferase [Oscillospiraceae bacterium]|jgi:glycosyltransferase involved in cell wall biosynthesis|nr:glycosyltransferase [Oscillospiraceae bacterium]
MPTISLCMIVKNEEQVLARCLASAKDLVDEIVIVDTGSSDKTKEIASQFTDRIYDFEWIDNFAAARNFAFAKGTGDYLMWLDADDIIQPEDAEKFRAVCETLLPHNDTIMMKYNIAFDEHGNPTFSYFRERVVRNCPAAKWEGAIHEVITPFGRIAHSHAAVTHRRKGKSDPLRNLRLFEKLLKKGAAFSPREQFYYARELYYAARYADAIAAFEKFLKDGNGWMENNIEACRVLAQCETALEHPEKALQALLRSFHYDTPRAEICCELGYYYFARDQFKRASYWYRAALLSERNDVSGAFVLEDCYGYLPFLQLCVCCDRLGQREEAVKWNDRAGLLRPQSAAYLHNKKYFDEPTENGAENCEETPVSKDTKKEEAPA